MQRRSPADIMTRLRTPDVYEARPDAMAEVATRRGAVSPDRLGSEFESWLQGVTTKEWDLWEHPGSSIGAAQVFQGIRSCPPLPKTPGAAYGLPTEV